MLDQNLVVEAVIFLVHSYHMVERALGERHAVALEWKWRLAQAEYRRHFFGEEREYDFRSSFINSLGMQMEILRDSADILGRHHPLTLGVVAAVKLCFEEQLDWTNDDIPDDILEGLEGILHISRA